MEKRAPDILWFKISQKFLFRNWDTVWKDLLPIMRLLGKKVFLDMKLSEVDHQLAGAAEALLERGRPAMLNCMANAATIGDLKGTDKELDAVAGFAKVCRQFNVEPCVVTVLTSKDRGFVMREHGRTPEEQVSFYVSNVIVPAGITHIVCGPREARYLNDHPHFKGLGHVKVTPSIRPEGTEKGSQSASRQASHTEAAKWGANLLVMGGPITNAANPAAAFNQYKAEIAAAIN